MPYRDIREFIGKLDDEGELARIGSEVDWNLELGAISRRCLERKGPALFFENIKGYPSNYRVFANILGASKPYMHARLSLSLDLPKDTPSFKLIDLFTERMKQPPIKPRIVSDAPCKENILKGDRIDLYRFPVPWTHGCDGGRFMGSWHADVTRDPDTAVVNWGMYRHQLIAKDAVATLMFPAFHGGIHLAKYMEKDEVMPTAIAIGTEPVSSIVAGTRFPHPPDETIIASTIRGEAIELVKCETNDLYVPATSEIVIEGYIKPRDKAMEGPYGEYTGYNAAGVAERPVIRVTCVTHRNDPILTTSNMGKPWDESHVMHSIVMSAILSNQLRSQGFSFKSLYVPATESSLIVSVKPLYAGYTRTLANAIRASEAGSWIPYLILVGDDVDVTNSDEVLWCLTTRMHPIDGIHQECNTPGNVANPFLNPQERKDNYPGSRVLFEAVFPAEWPREQVPVIVDFEHAWPEDVRKRVLNRWREYGLEKI